MRKAIVSLHSSRWGTAMGVTVSPGARGMGRSGGLRRMAILPNFANCCQGWLRIKKAAMRGVAWTGIRWVFQASRPSWISPV